MGLLKPLLLSLALSSSLMAWAKAPVVTYTLMGSNPTLSYSSIGDLIDNVNDMQQATYDACMASAGESFNCVKMVIVATQAYESSGFYNGIPLMTGLKRNMETTSKIGPTSPTEYHTVENVGDLGAYAGFSCTGFSAAVVTGVGAARKMDCVTPHPPENPDLDSCPTEDSGADAQDPHTGNPIVIQTGEKTLHEVDYQSADGFLRFERKYSSESIGWVFIDGMSALSAQVEGATACQGGEWRFPRKYSATPDQPSGFVVNPIFRCMGGLRYEYPMRNFEIGYRSGVLKVSDDGAGSGMLIKGSWLGKFSVKDAAPDSESDVKLRLSDPLNRTFFTILLVRSRGLSTPPADS